MATSSIVTGGVTISAATLAPLVQWALNGFHYPVPESVPFLIAAGIITVGHAVYNLAIAWINTKSSSQNQPSKG